MLFWVCFAASGQNNIKKNASVPYTLGPPTFTVNTATSSEIAIDTSTGKIYQWHRTSGAWLQIGQGIDVIAGSIPPAYTPARNQSLFAINAVDSLYYYRSGAWRHLNAGGSASGVVVDSVMIFGAGIAGDSLKFGGNYVSLPITGTGLPDDPLDIFANGIQAGDIAADAVGNSELAANAVDSTNIVNGGVSVLDLGQHGAASGQVLKWNGTQWLPADDNTTVGASGHVVAGNGTGVAAKDTLNFVDNDIQFTVSNTTTATTVIGIIAPDSVNATHIAANSIGSSEMADNAVGSAEISDGTVALADMAANSIDSTKIINGGISVLDIGQHGATSTQVLKWNGTQWLPADDATTVGASGHVIADDGTGVAQKDTLNFVSSTRISATASNTATATNVTLDLAQQGAASGEVLKWNGTSWAPGTDNNTDAVTGSGAAGQVTYWNGSSTLTGESAFQYNGATDALSIGAANAVSITNSGITPSQSFVIGGSSSPVTVFPSTGATTIASGSTSSSAILIQPTANSTNSTSGIDIGGSSALVQTSGTRNYMKLTAGFAPTSGTAVHNSFTLNGTFNQTGGASGITRGIYLSETLTAVADFRAIEIGVNHANAKGIYQTGASVVNNFVGKTAIGSTTAPARTLDVTGEARVSDLTTDTPTRIVGADADGDLGAIKLGTGLSLSNDTLNGQIGTITGTGASGQVTYWTGTTTQGGENEHYWDATNNRLGIGTTSPSQSVDIRGGRLKLERLDNNGALIFANGTTTDVNTRVDVDTSGNMIFRTYGTTVGFQTYDTNAGAAVFNWKNNGQALAPATGGFYIVDGNAGVDGTQSSSLTYKDFLGNFYWRKMNSGTNQMLLAAGKLRVGDASSPGASLDILGAGATSSTYTLIASNSSGTTTTAALVVRDDNRVGIRTNAPQVPLNVVGTGTTSATTALLVEGSAGQDNLSVRDDGMVTAGAYQVNSAAPTVSYGTGAGTGPTTDLIAGGQNAVNVFWTTGTGPATNATVFTINLPKNFANGCAATWVAGNDTTRAIIGNFWLSGTSNNSITVAYTGTLAASTAYALSIVIMGY